MTSVRARPHLVCVGIVTLDRIVRLDEFPAGDGKYSGNGYLEVGGGVAANAAATAVRLGGSAGFIGCIGDDNSGDEILREFDTLGVGTDGVQRIANRSTPTSVVLVDQHGHREVIDFAAPDFFERANPDFAAELDGADAVFVDCRWLAGAGRAVTSARERGLPSIVDVDRSFDDDRNDRTVIFENATHLVFSRDALVAHTAEQRPERALRVMRRQTDAWLAVNTERHGVSWLDGDDVRHQPAFSVREVDTLAAGDVFHGAFALAIAEGSTEEDAVRFGAAATAAKCSRSGGRSGIPDRVTVDALFGTPARGSSTVADIERRQDR
jgi:sugar/nucleoside kinase (ribokinase family)